MKQTLYISLPISGRPLDEVRQRASFVKAHVLAQGYDAITPFDVCPDPTLPYEELLAKDIAALLCCNGIVSDHDWDMSRGCRAERAIAEIYDLNLYHFYNNTLRKDRPRITLD